MPTLNWIGKDKITNHDKDVPFRLLKKNNKLSLGQSDNLVVEGDNLEALKALMPFYYNKIKCIYIDPPYNTGNEGWVYNDRVNSPRIQEWLGKAVGPEGEDLTRHDKWLCMMYPRLKLLKDLLEEDGVIFISIDDNEHCNLKMLMDEIFGAENFIANVPRRTKSAGKTTETISLNHDYVLIYAKNREEVKFSTIAIEDSAYKYKDKYYSERGPYALSQTLDYDSLSYSDSLDYELKLNNHIFYPGGDKKSYLNRKAGHHRASDWTWRWGKELVNFGNKNGFIVIKNGKNGQPRIYTKTYFKVVIEKVNGEYNIISTDRAKNLSTLDLMESIYSNDVSKKDIRAIFGASAEFAYPKPVQLIKYLINSIYDHSNLIILDSFAGSGTTGQAVLELNKKDGGNRKFILVEMEEKIAKEITSERIRRVSKGYSYKTNGDKPVKVAGLGGGFEYAELGPTLFSNAGAISDDVKYFDLASYVFFTETLTNLEKKKVKEPYLGNFADSDYYLLFTGKDKNILDRKFLKQIQNKTRRNVIYADKCLLDEDVLEKYRIVFKQIPYQIKIY